MATVRSGGEVSVQVLVTEEVGHSESEWKKIGTFKLSVPSGEIILFGPESDNLKKHRMLLPSAGDYEAIAYSAGTESILDEMDLKGDDSYHIVLRKNEQW